jgi:hypothetical protein
MSLICVVKLDSFLRNSIGIFKIIHCRLRNTTDIAIAVSLYQTASKYKIKYIISGGNFLGEGTLPLTWGYHVLKDEKLYRHIVKKHSKTKIKKVPIVGLKGEIYYKFLKRIKFLYPLNFIDYDKD